MARTQGIPSRLAEGFILKPADGSKTGFNWIAAGNTAHAWAELYFAGIGWLTFDPTPGNSVNDPPNPTPGVTGSPTGVPTLSPGQTATPTPPPVANGNADTNAPLYWLLLIIFILLIAVLILSLLARHRHQSLFDLKLVSHRHPEPADRLEFYYQDILHQLTCLDISPETGETLLDFAARIEHRFRLEGLDATAALASVGRWRYGAVVPDQASLELLAELHMRIEERLQISLGRWSYFFNRVIKAWRVK